MCLFLSWKAVWTLATVNLGCPEQGVVIIGNTFCSWNLKRFFRRFQKFQIWNYWFDFHWFGWTDQVLLSCSCFIRVSSCLHVPLDNMQMSMTNVHQQPGHLCGQHSEQQSTRMMTEVNTGLTSAERFSNASAHWRPPDLRQLWTSTCWPVISEWHDNSLYFSKDCNPPNIQFSDRETLCEPNLVKFLHQRPDVLQWGAASCGGHTCQHRSTTTHTDGMFP